MRASDGNRTTVTISIAVGEFCRAPAVTCRCPDAATAALDPVGPEGECPAYEPVPRTASRRTPAPAAILPVIRFTQFRLYSLSTNAFRRQQY